MFFPFTSASGFALSKCLQPGFVVSQLSHGTYERRSKCADIFSASPNFGSSDGSGSDLNVTGTRPGITTDEKLDALLSQFAQFKEQIAQIPTLTNWMSRMDSHITRTLGDFATRLTEMEQNFSTLTARMCKVETYPVRHDPGLQLNRLTAP